SVTNCPLESRTVTGNRTSAVSIAMTASSSDLRWRSCRCCFSCAVFGSCAPAREFKDGKNGEAQRLEVTSEPLSKECKGEAKKAKRAKEAKRPTLSPLLPFSPFLLPPRISL